MCTGESLYLGLHVIHWGDWALAVWSISALRRLGAGDTWMCLRTWREQRSIITSLWPMMQGTSRSWRCWNKKSDCNGKPSRNYRNFVTISGFGPQRMSQQRMREADSIRSWKFVSTFPFPSVVVTYLWPWRLQKWPLPLSKLHWKRGWRTVCWFTAGVE